MAKEHLIKTREIIANGWTQGDLWNTIGGQKCYCLDGAVAAAHGYDTPDYHNLREDDVYPDIVYLASLAIPLNNQDEADSYGSTLDTWKVSDANRLAIDMVYLFNDKKERTKEEVLAFLDKAIENYPDETGV
jgi:hypothetical protein